jgi:oligoribonuclease
VDRPPFLCDQITCEKLPKGSLKVPREDLILFLDLETTGTDENLDEIIEVGVIALDATSPGFPEVGYFSHIIAPSRDAFDRMDSKQKVRDMHKKNGLYDEIEDEINDLTKTGNNIAANVDEKLMIWLRRFVGRNNTQIPYGGSGVAHFDRRFIKKYLPKFDKMLTHWAYDVGTVRRMMLLAGQKPADAILEEAGAGKTHRAIDDARVHANEFRYYIPAFRGDFN